MAIVRIVIVLLISLIGCVSTFAGDAFDFYIETCRHSGYNPAEIAYFQADLKMSTKFTLPDSLTEGLKKKLRDSLESKLKNDAADNKDTIDAHNEVIKKMFASEAKSRLLKVHVKNTNAPVGLEDKPVNVLEIDLVSKETFLFSIGTKIFPANVNPNDVKKQSDIFQLEQLTTINADRFSDGRYCLLGRIQMGGVISDMNLLLSRDANHNLSFSESNIAAVRKRSISNGQTFSLSQERTKYAGDYSAYILEVHEKGLLRHRIWVDPDRGYICPKEQHYDHDGKLIFDIVSENFILDEYSQKWFPTKVVYISTTSADNKIVSEFHIVSNTLILNKPIPDSVFSLTVQKDTRVDDTRRDDMDKVTFFANQTGKLDLPTVEKKSLDEIPWLSQRGVAQYYPPPIEKAYFGWIRITLMTAGVILIIAGLVMRFFKK